MKWGVRSTVIRHSTTLNLLSQGQMKSGKPHTYSSLPVPYDSVLIHYKVPKDWLTIPVLQVSSLWETTFTFSTLTRHV